MWFIVILFIILVFLLFQKKEKYSPPFSAHLYPFTQASTWDYEQMSRLPYYPPVGPYTIGWNESLQNKIKYPTQTRIYNYLYPS